LVFKVASAGGVATLKLLIRLFLALFLLGLFLYGIAAASHAYHPVLVFLIAPAFWIGMLIRRAEPGGRLSMLFGITVTSLLYSLLAWVCIAFVSKVLPRDRMEKRGPA
jgi:hypothetical protein